MNVKNWLFIARSIIGSMVIVIYSKNSSRRGPDRETKIVYLSISHLIIFQLRCCGYQLPVAGRQLRVPVTSCRIAALFALFTEALA